MCVYDIQASMKNQQTMDGIEYVPVCKTSWKPPMIPINSCA